MDKCEKPNNVEKPQQKIDSTLDRLEMRIE